MKIYEGFQKVTKRAGLVRISGIVDHSNMVLTFTSDEYKPFDKAKYLAKGSLRQSQKDWVNSLDDNDGYVSFTLKAEQSGKTYPTSLLLSELKAFDKITTEGEKVVVKDGAVFNVIAGVLVQQ